MFEIRVAVQMTANARRAKGDHGDAAAEDMVERGYALAARSATKGRPADYSSTL
jgi:hypothetical protein